MASPDHIFPSPVTFQETGSGILKVDFEIAQKMLEFEKEYPETIGMSAKDRRAFFNAKMEELRGKRGENHKRRDEAQRKIDQLKREEEVFIGIQKWASSLKMEKPDGPSFRKMRRAVSEGNVIYLSKDLDAKIPAHDFEKEVFRFAEILVIEHDWAAAFKNADVTKGENVRLPYDVCAFEFKFSGRPLIVLATQFDTDIAFCPAIPYEDIWVITEFVLAVNGFDNSAKGENSLYDLFGMIASQIRAACIALDAEVATSEVVREPHVSGRGRNSYQALKPYHVVSLANRGPRALPIAGQPTGRHVRLHFRRGHWRHFESHKTWIKWMLVGDPDLGFVDKHYKL